MSNPAMYLFGDHAPGIAAILGRGSFKGLVHELFTAAEILPPPNLPSWWDEAIRLELLASNGKKYRAGRRLVIIPASAEHGLIDFLESPLSRYAEVASDVAQELRSVYVRTEAAKRFSWSQVCHTVMAGTFLDLAMGREILLRGTISRRSIGDTVIWAFQSISAENAFGVSAVAAGPSQRTLFGELWHRRTRRRHELRLGPSLVEVLARTAKGDPSGCGAKEILYLKYIKLLRKAGGSLQLTVPFFGIADTDLLLPPLTSGARRLVEEAIAPALRLLDHHSWWRAVIHDEAYRHAAVRLILEFGIDRVIARGVFDPFPSGTDLPIEWGRWLWEEREGPNTIIPHVASLQTEKRLAS